MTAFLADSTTAGTAEKNAAVKVFQQQIALGPVFTSVEEALKKKRVSFVIGKAETSDDFCTMRLSSSDGNFVSINWAGIKKTKRDNWGTLTIEGKGAITSASYAHWMLVFRPVAALGAAADVLVREC